MAGRVQLVNNTIQGMQSYLAHVFVLPKKILSMVEQVCNSFIRSLDSQQDSKPCISWKHVFLLRSFGGLNICNLQVGNDVALLKKLWALPSKRIDCGLSRSMTTISRELILSLSRFLVLHLGC